MSENYKRLDAIQQENKDLLNQKTNLKNTERKGQLSDNELEGIAELFTELERQVKYWQEEVSKENIPEETSKSFDKADADWIASATGVNCKHREWTTLASENGPIYLSLPWL